MTLLSKSFALKTYFINLSPWERSDLNLITFKFQNFRNLNYTRNQSSILLYGGTPQFLLHPFAKIGAAVSHSCIMLPIQNFVILR